jgi:hypothetical protein
MHLGAFSANANDKGSEASANSEGCQKYVRELAD